MNFIRKINKKAEGESTMKPIITIILVILVVAAVFILLWRMGLKEKLENLFPDFEKQKLVEQAQEEQLQVSDAEKKIGPQYNNYPTIFLRYFGGYDDDFWVRWNFNLSKPQIAMHINSQALFTKTKQSEEWLIKPISDEGFKISNLDDKEKRQIEFIMSSNSYTQWLNRTLSLVNPKINGLSKQDYTILISAPISSNVLESGSLPFFFNFYETNDKALNDYLRENQGDYFASYDKSRSEIAKQQISSIKNSAISFSASRIYTEIKISNLDGWYFIGSFKNSDKCKNGCMCLCSTEKCISEYDVCEVSQILMETSYYLINNNYLIKLGKK